MRHLRTFAIISFIILMFSSNTLAQECPDIISEALEVTDTACSQLGRSEVCYGHFDVAATSNDGSSVTSFQASGDIIAVEELSSIQTAGFNLDEGIWGVAFMNLQANLPDTLPGQNVIFILFGDTTIEAVDSDIEGYTAPMQAFRLSTGIGEAACDEVPKQGVLIQSPEDLEVSFLVNGIETSMGSTLYLSADNNTDSTQVTVLEGHAEIPKDKETEIVEAGFSVDLSEKGETGEITPLNTEQLQSLPINLLPRPIAIPVILAASEATANWIDSGISVEEGKQYHIRATGSANLWPKCKAICQDNAEFTCSNLCSAIQGGPAGTEYVSDIVASSDPYMVLPGERFLVLLGRIGEGETIVIGDDYILEANATGNLFFRINEDTRVTGDEPGAYAVSVLPLDD